MKDRPRYHFSNINVSNAGVGMSVSGDVDLSVDGFAANKVGKGIVVEQNEIVIPTHIWQEFLEIYKNTSHPDMHERAKQAIGKSRTVKDYLSKNHIAIASLLTAMANYLK